MKTEKEIREITESYDDSADDFPAMTYEQGVREALDWVLGEVTDDEFTPHIYTH